MRHLVRRFDTFLNYQIYFSFIWLWPLYPHLLELALYRTCLQSIDGHRVSDSVSRPSEVWYKNSQTLRWILTLFLNLLKVPSARTHAGVALMVCNMIHLLSSAYPQNQFPKGLHFQVLTLITSSLCLNLIIQTWWVHHLKDDTMATFKISPFPTSNSFTKIYQYTEFLYLFITHS